MSGPSVACPLGLSDAVPSGPPPSVNETVPVGFPATLLLTVAVKVIDWPVTAGFAEELKVVVVGFLLGIVTC